MVKNKVVLTYSKEYKSAVSSHQEADFPSTENWLSRSERTHMSGVALQRGVGSKHGAAAAQERLWGAV